MRLLIDITQGLILDTAKKILRIPTKAEVANGDWSPIWKDLDIEYIKEIPLSFTLRDINNIFVNQAAKSIDFNLKATHKNEYILNNLSALNINEFGAIDAFMKNLYNTNKESFYLSKKLNILLKTPCKLFDDNNILLIDGYLAFNNIENILQNKKEYNCTIYDSRVIFYNWLKQKKIKDLKFDKISDAHHPEMQLNNLKHYINADYVNYCWSVPHNKKLNQVYSSYYKSNISNYGKDFEVNQDRPFVTKKLWPTINNKKYVREFITYIPEYKGIYNNFDNKKYFIDIEPFNTYQIEDGKKVPISYNEESSEWETGIFRSYKQRPAIYCNRLFDQIIYEFMEENPTINVYKHVKDKVAAFFVDENEYWSNTMWTLPLLDSEVYKPNNEEKQEFINDANINKLSTTETYYRQPPGYPSAPDLSKYETRRNLNRSLSGIYNDSIPQSYLYNNEFQAYYECLTSGTNMANETSMTENTQMYLGGYLVPLEVNLLNENSQKAYYFDTNPKKLGVAHLNVNKTNKIDISFDFDALVSGFVTNLKDVGVNDFFGAFEPQTDSLDWNLAFNFYIPGFGTLDKTYTFCEYWSNKNWSIPVYRVKGKSNFASGVLGINGREINTDTGGNGISGYWFQEFIRPRAKENSYDNSIQNMCDKLKNNQPLPNLMPYQNSTSFVLETGAVNISQLTPYNIDADGYVDVPIYLNVGICKNEYPDKKFNYETYLSNQTTESNNDVMWTFDSMPKWVKYDDYLNGSTQTFLPDYVNDLRNYGYKDDRVDLMRLHAVSVSINNLNVDITQTETIKVRSNTLVDWSVLTNSVSESCADFMTSFCKTFNLYIDFDNDKNIYIDSFEQHFNDNDKSILTLNKNEINNSLFINFEKNSLVPTTIDNFLYTMSFKDWGETYFNKQYKTLYDQPYGSLKINTFDDYENENSSQYTIKSEKKELIENNCFRSCIQSNALVPDLGLPTEYNIDGTTLKYVNNYGNLLMENVLGKNILNNAFGQNVTQNIHYNYLFLTDDSADEIVNDEYYYNCEKAIDFSHSSYAYTNKETGITIPRSLNRYFVVAQNTLLTKIDQKNNGNYCSQLYFMNYANPGAVFYDTLAHIDSDKNSYKNYVINVNNSNLWDKNMFLAFNANYWDFYLHNKIFKTKALLNLTDPTKLFKHFYFFNNMYFIINKVSNYVSPYIECDVDLLLVDPKDVFVRKNRFANYDPTEFYQVGAEDNYNTIDCSDNFDLMMHYEGNDGDWRLVDIIDQSTGEWPTWIDPQDPSIVNLMNGGFSDAPYTVTISPNITDFPRQATFVFEYDVSNEEWFFNKAGKWELNIDTETKTSEVYLTQKTCKTFRVQLYGDISAIQQNFPELDYITAKVYYRNGSTIESVLIDHSGELYNDFLYYNQLGPDDTDVENQKCRRIEIICYDANNNKIVSTYYKPKLMLHFDNYFGGTFNISSYYYYGDFNNNDLPDLFYMRNDLPTPAVRVIFEEKSYRNAILNVGSYIYDIDSEEMVDLYSQTIKYEVVNWDYGQNYKNLFDGILSSVYSGTIISLDDISFTYDQAIILYVPKKDIYIVDGEIAQIRKAKQAYQYKTVRYDSNTQTYIDDENGDLYEIIMIFDQNDIYYNNIDRFICNIFYVTNKTLFINSNIIGKCKVEYYDINLYIIGFDIANYNELISIPAGCQYINIFYYDIEGYNKSKATDGVNIVNNKFEYITNIVYTPVYVQPTLDSMNIVWDETDISTTRYTLNGSVSITNPTNYDYKLVYKDGNTIITEIENSNLLNVQYISNNCTDTNFDLSVELWYRPLNEWVKCDESTIMVANATNGIYPINLTWCYTENEASQVYGQVSWNDPTSQIVDWHIEYNGVNLGKPINLYASANATQKWYTFVYSLKNDDVTYFYQDFDVMTYTLNSNSYKYSIANGLLVNQTCDISTRQSSSQVKIRVRNNRVLRNLPASTLISSTYNNGVTNEFRLYFDGVEQPNSTIYNYNFAEGVNITMGLTNGSTENPYSGKATSFRIVIDGNVYDTVSNVRTQDFNYYFQYTNSDGTVPSITFVVVYEPNDTLTINDVNNYNYTITHDYTGLYSGQPFGMRKLNQQWKALIKDVNNVTQQLTSTYVPIAKWVITIQDPDLYAVSNVIDVYAYNN